MHTVKEVICLGPGGYCTQFPMECTIGDLGQEIKQPSNPFANLSQCVLCCAQVNALKVMLPEMDTDARYKIPRGAVDMGKGMLLLRPQQKVWYFGKSEEEKYLFEQLSIDWVCQWGCLHLPNGQIAHSQFVEIDLYKKCQLRNSRNVKIVHNDIEDFAEVWFYFLNTTACSANSNDSDSGSSDIGNNMNAYAVVSVYSWPDPDLLRQSSGALWALPVDQIQSVVSMQPLPPLAGECNDRWFVVEKPGLDNAIFTGHEEDMNDL
ncbi:hypothetical protein GYMLUDRAFT_62546 [Collybiopsis luxurians FD-317 M1]|uniref:Uncharacterized protein n=1 Tax=Collybiopsis luxurians FD-317 M1 TaxID=944289 RepID=A0A0D0CBJ8_9AGAR|nr:hypothetical protein GYMLUDRAFT_62546 [Collybiopsis luxurians FD-317 M1]